MKEFKFRPAKAEDYQAIRSLVRAAKINPSGIKWARFLVAENDEGDIVACGQIKPHRDGSQELASLVVDPAYQKQGLARDLVHRITANQDGPIYLMCRSSLGDFYRKLGFEVVASDQMPPYFRRISRLASLAEILQQEGETLLIMGNQNT